MQYKSILLSLALSAALPACTIHPVQPDQPLADVEQAEADAIIAVLDAQQAAWNAGDIDGFMDGYWNSPEVRFASGGNLSFGWQPVLERYHAGYPDRAAMGMLSFDDLDVQVLGSDAAVVHGAWRLDRQADAPSGLFTLVLRKVDGAWRIVSDTTTSAD